MFCGAGMGVLEEGQIEALTQDGWFTQENFLPAALCESLLDNFQNLKISGQLRQAAIGRAGGRVLAQDIRTDQTFWLDGESPAQGEMLSLMEGLRQQLNRELFLGLSSYEAHFACYQAGGFYKKHLDSFKGQRNRIVSTVLYLTSGWQENDRGHLVIYDSVDQEKEIVRVLPRAGTLVCFMSEDMAHEVLPPVRERVSIAGWFRTTGSDIVNL